MGQEPDWVSSRSLRILKVIHRYENFIYLLIRAL
jgi:hypothetical protein